MKPEEEEIYNILKICFKSQETIIKQCVNRLKEYDPNTLKTVDLILNEEDNSLKENLEEIHNLEKEIEPTSEEDYSLISYVRTYSFQLETLFFNLGSKRRLENSHIDILTEEIIKEKNLEPTPQEIKEFKDIFKKYLNKEIKLKEEEINKGE